MKIFRLIIGLAMAVFGLVCIFTPLKTSFGINNMIAVLAIVYGIVGIISGIVTKSRGLHFIFCIVSILFGIAVFCLPLVTVITNNIAARLVACWVIAQGFVTIATSKVVKAECSKKWILLLLSGIVGVMLGIYAFVHPLLFGILFAWVLGFIIGAFFIETGMSILFLPSAKKAA